MEEEHARKDELHRLASVKLQGHNMGHLLSKEIQQLKDERVKEARIQAAHERAVQHERAVKSAHHKEIARIEKERAELQAKDAERLSVLKHKLLGLEDNTHTKKARVHTMEAHSAHTKKTPLVTQARKQQLAEMDASGMKRLFGAASKKTRIAQREAMDKEANKVSRMLEQSSKLQQNAILDASKEVALLHQTLKTKAFTSALHQSAVKDRTHAFMAAGNAKQLPLQDGPRAAHFTSPAAGAGFIDSTPQKGLWQSISSKVDSEARLASLSSSPIRKAAIHAMKQLDQKVTTDLALLESPAGF